jgi:hypothetical protein
MGGALKLKERWVLFAATSADFFIWGLLHAFGIQGGWSYFASFCAFWFVYSAGRSVGIDDS